MVGNEGTIKDIFIGTKDTDGIHHILCIITDDETEVDVSGILHVVCKFCVFTGSEI
jgi:hypothetical protein